MSEHTCVFFATLNLKHVDMKAKYNFIHIMKIFFFFFHLHIFSLFYCVFHVLPCIIQISVFLLIIVFVLITLAQESAKPTNECSICWKGHDPPFGGSGSSNLLESTSKHFLASSMSSFFIFVVLPLLPSGFMLPHVKACLLRASVEAQHGRSVEVDLCPE